VSDTDDYPGGWFGESWGAPVCADRSVWPTPVGEECLQCLVPIVLGDRGLIIPYWNESGKMRLTVEHMRCFVRNLRVGETAYWERGE
jgi:hypothetical protein